MHSWSVSDLLNSHLTESNDTQVDQSLTSLGIVSNARRTEEILLFGMLYIASATLLGVPILSLTEKLENALHLSSPSNSGGH